MSGTSNRPVFGVLEWLRPGEEERVERLLAAWLREFRSANAAREVLATA